MEKRRYYAEQQGQFERGVKMPDQDVPCRVPESLESIYRLAVWAAGTIVTGPRWNDPDFATHGSVAARQGSTTTPALKRRSLSKGRAGMGAMPGHRENCGKDSQGSAVRAYPFHPRLFVQN